MKILVTGASGFIGKHLVNSLLNLKKTQVYGMSRNSHVLPSYINFDGTEDGAFFNNGITLKGDVTSEKDVIAIMKPLQPDIIFHFAANPLVKDNSVEANYLNYMPTHFLLKHSKKLARFVFASSCAVYGDSHNPFVETKVLNPTSVYGASKAASEHLVQAFTNCGLVNGISVRMAATIGRGAKHGLIPDLVKKIKSNSENLELFGSSPGAFKPFTHVSDVVDGLIKLAFKPFNGPVNLANETELSVLDVAKLAMDTLNVHKNITWTNSTWTGDNPIVRVCSHLAKSYGWNPKFDSKLAIVQAIKDIVEG